MSYKLFSVPKHRSVDVCVCAVYVYVYVYVHVYGVTLCPN